MKDGSEHYSVKPLMERSSGVSIVAVLRAASSLFGSLASAANEELVLSVDLARRYFESNHEIQKTVVTYFQCSRVESYSMRVLRRDDDRQWRNDNNENHYIGDIDYTLSSATSITATTINNHVWRKTIPEFTQTGSPGTRRRR